MREKLLNKKDIAAMFGTSPDMAASILRDNGIYPIDLGCGRGKGLRWLESAANEILRKLQDNARPKQKTAKPKPEKIPEISLANLSNKSIYELVFQSTH